MVQRVTRLKYTSLTDRLGLGLIRGSPLAALLWPTKRERMPHEGQVAQLVEQRTENPRVGGSIPPLATILSGDCPFGTVPILKTLACVLREPKQLWC